MQHYTRMLWLQVLHVLGSAVPVPPVWPLPVSLHLYASPQHCCCQCCWHDAAAVRLPHEWLCDPAQILAPLGPLVSLSTVITASQCKACSSIWFSDACMLNLLCKCALCSCAVFARKVCCAICLQTSGWHVLTQPCDNDVTTAARLYQPLTALQSCQTPQCFA